MSCNELRIYRLLNHADDQWIRRLDQFPAAAETTWLEVALQIPNLVLDILVILDYPPVEVDSYSFLDGGIGRLRFQVMSVVHRDGLYVPGIFTSYLAELLGNVASPDNRTTREEVITTEWLMHNLSSISPFPVQEINPSLMMNTVEDGYLPSIVIEPIGLTFFDLGHYHALSRYEQAKHFEFLSLIYENGLTEVFKVNMLQNSSGANGLQSTVNALSLVPQQEIFVL
jgi:hypothetical protein